MSESVTISSAPPATTSMNYSALREGGLELIRRWAGQSWTDHNVHDPGVTILEACSYAITELGLRLQLDVADLLRSGEAHGAADLEPAHRVLPVAPVTPQDLRRVLLDHPLVRDAQFFLRAHSEVAFYEVAGGTPPLTYTAGSARIRPAGLYEALIELADRPLNTNTYPLPVTVGAQTYEIDLALPFWDEAEAAPFRDGAVVTSVAMLPDGAEVWRALPEPLSYYGRIDVGYTGASGPASIVLWGVLQITTVLTQPGAVVPGILAAARAAVESTAPAAPINQFGARVRSAVASVNQLETYLAGWRNLGEQAVRIGVARVQEIALRARIEVTGGIDVEELLAGIFADVDQRLSPRVRFESLASRRGSESLPERIFDGPLLRHGFLASDTLADIQPRVLFLSDVLRLIMRRRGGTRADVVSQENPTGRDIVAVTDLALANFINNRPVTSDAEDCLRLVETERYRPRLSIAKSRIVVVRNDSEVSYDGARVERLFDDLITQAEAGSRTAETSPVWPVPRGQVQPVEDYTPVQADLPSNYGVGDSGLPESAGPARHAAVRQLQGYLLLFEQFLADTTAQLGNINRFFSGAADEDTTYFTRPLFDVPGAPRLLKRFPPGADWTTFVQDPDNPVARALHDAAESRTQLLDRRNRMLDHLLARQGEDTVALGQELHRWAHVELAAANLPVAQQPARIAARRDAANVRLIRIKSALLRETPELNAFRLQARSHPWSGDAVILRIESSAAGFRWHMALGGQELLRSVDPTFPTGVAASIAAEHTLAFAARAVLYRNDHVGAGFRRLRLRDGTSATAAVLAESSQTFPNVGAATTAIADLAAAFTRVQIASSLSPMERRVAFLTGIRSQQRRRLLPPAAGHFSIVNDPPGPGTFGKRWRLTEPAPAGQVLLNSPSRFQAATDALATELAEQSTRQVMRYGIDEWNYVVSPAAGNTFTYELKDPSGTTIAVRDATLPSRGDAERALAATIDLLYRSYSAEGFFLVEHLLLRPRQAGQPFLSLPVGGARERDPYSQRLSIVFPSGYARNHSLDRKTAPTTPVAPHRFRDPEFRRHAERVIQQACPAHLMPTIHWVDRMAPATPISAASFDVWEQRYFDWLETAIIPGAPAATVDAARTALVQSLNAIANDAP
jgi:hypothetical protein